MARLVDLSHDVTDGMITYPGLPVPRLGSVFTHAESRGRYAEGTEFAIGTIELCTNTGTYLDTPFHRFADGHDLGALPLDRCADLPLVVVHMPTGAQPIGPDALDDLDVEGSAVLFATGWSQHWGSERYLSDDHPYLAVDTVRALVAGGAVLVGIDSLNIDTTVGGERPAHTELLAAGIPIVEHLTNLAGLPAQGARFTAVPPKVVGLGTFTVRAFAAVPDAGDPPRAAVCEVVFDCADVRVLSAFWAEVVGGTPRVRSDDWATVRDPRPGGLLVAFQRVPEGKVVKNRVHLDIWSDDIPADTDRLVAGGATATGAIRTDEAGSFQVLLDPEGNEFCLVG
jgi:kynurenine formamidase/predicted enzyme related to lactoylglutathione lyase